MTERTSLTVDIGGEQFTLRTDADVEYARRCAEHVDAAVSEVFAAGGTVEHHRAVILAALSMADELFRAREEADALRRKFAGAASRLAADVRAVAGGD